MVLYCLLSICAVNLLPPPRAFLIFFLSAKSDRETGREQKGASGVSPNRLFLYFFLAQRAIVRLGENKKVRAGAGSE